MVKGEPPPTATLADRMAALRVPGVSIAVIRDMRKADAWRRHCAKVDADAVINSWYDNREYEEYV